MEKYSSYKDSGVQWLGQIPIHWSINRLASYFTERKTKVSDKDFAPLSVTKRGILPQLENVAKTDDGDNRKLVKANDFVINSRSDRRGSSGVSPMDGSVSLINIVLSPRPGVNPGFCNYLLKSYAFIEEFYRNGHGIVADLWTTRYDEMKTIKICIPPYEEQEAIVAYLDAATAKIDEAIAQQQRMIDLLNERKQIIINDAVSSGLGNDFSALLSFEGRESITIPKGWQLLPLKSKISFANGYAFDSESFKKEGEVPVIRISSISDGTVSYDDIVYVDRDKGLEPFLTKKGDLLIAMSGATTGKVGFDIGGGSYINQRVGIIRSSCQKWIYYWLMTSFFKEYIYLSALGSAQPNISSSGIKNFRILYPKDGNYSKIVDRLDVICQEIDKALGAFLHQIDLLQERKQIIINDVVTGKVRIV